MDVAIRFLWTAVFAVILVTVTLSSHATEGYFRMNSSGTRSLGRAGTGVAFSQDALSPATNPAGLAFVGNRFDFALALFSPRREYTITGAPSGVPGSFGLFPGNVESDSEYFVVPDMGWSKALDDRSAFGIALYANGGLNTDYPAVGICPPGAPNTRGTFCGGRAGVDLQQLFIAPTYSHRFTDRFAWGVSTIFAYQRFRATGLSAFAPFSSDPDNLSDNGYDNSVGAGLQVGFEGEVISGLRLGASYRSRVWMQAFDKYAGLFAENGDFDIPPALSVGLAWQFDGNKTVFADYKRIWFSDIDSVGNSFDRLTTGAALGSGDGPGFGWDDVDVFKLGFEWQANSNWTWRAGYSHNTQPISSSEVLFNILAPGVIENHFTLGFTRQLNKNSEFSVSLMYAPMTKVSGQNPFDPGQAIKLEMNQFELGISWAISW